MTFADEMSDLMNAMTTAYHAGDAEACARLFAPHAVLMSPYAPQATGRSAIQELHQAWVGTGGTAKALSVLECGHSGDLGWCLAAFDEGDPTADAGKSLNIVARQQEGGWLITHCSLSADDPPLAEG
jgi:ketosteroid isomerase-like protein